MDNELLLTELNEITELLMVVSNHDPTNDLLEDTYHRCKLLRDQLEEEIE